MGIFWDWSYVYLMTTLSGAPDKPAPDTVTRNSDQNVAQRYSFSYRMQRLDPWH